MLSFCTLFDVNYLTRGVILYESLKNSVRGDFKLYVLTLDNESLKILNKLNLEFLIPIRLRDFENRELLSIKSERTATEYCWT